VHHGRAQAALWQRQVEAMMMQTQMLAPMHERMALAHPQAWMHHGTTQLGQPQVQATTMKMQAPQWRQGSCRQGALSMQCAVRRGRGAQMSLNGAGEGRERGRGWEVEGGHMGKGD